ncbi:unnamed protein product [Medioppia subpectinata]|uniref:Uncharacterized protein n=1 Tax=Medioppia subpectinata TaxID=1979941 RepID=A0A7R9L716_9ACAR|nr:unnamed protein product [Medioppia subpectinata]CAG2115595.1 unnamed protein product [Medioppia subpectinata]
MLYKLLLIFIASGLVAANTTITSAQPSAPSTIQATPQVAAQAAVQPVVTETTGTSATITTPKTAINFEQAKNDIIRNIRHQYAILHTLTNEFKAIWRNETAYAEGVYKNITDNLNYYITDPDDKETAELDASLSSFYPFGGKESDYIDTIEKMNEYCR